MLLAALPGPQPGPLPGLGPQEARVAAQPDRPPFSAVLRLNVPAVSRCTAVLVAPDWAATAAHCLASRALGHMVQAGSVHLLAGYDRGTYRQHVVADAIRLPPGADPLGGPDRGTDLALLHLPTPMPGALPLLAALPRPGTGLQLAGFGQDRAERLVVDPACQALGTRPGRDGAPLLAHTCAATRGASGGAVLAADGSGGWALAGIAVGAAMGHAGGVAVPAASIRALLPPG